jgi:hypothetical protein
MKKWFSLVIEEPIDEEKILRLEKNFTFFGDLRFRKTS